MLSASQKEDPVRLTSVKSTTDLEEQDAAQGQQKIYTNYFLHLIENSICISITVQIHFKLLFNWFIISFGVDNLFIKYVL